MLSKNDHGFFLMVEGGLIDKQLHPHDWERAAYDTIEFDKAIEVA
ncbi:alkaline phosphatase, partial [Hydrogenibacillus schlegelii]